MGPSVGFSRSAGVVAGGGARTKIPPSSQLGRARPIDRSPESCSHPSGQLQASRAYWQASNSNGPIGQWWKFSLFGEIFLQTLWPRIARLAPLSFDERKLNQISSRRASWFGAESRAIEIGISPPPGESSTWRSDEPEP